MDHYEWSSKDKELEELLNLITFPWRLNVGDWLKEPNPDILKSREIAKKLNGKVIK